MTSFLQTGSDSGRRARTAVLEPPGRRDRRLRSGVAAPHRALGAALTPARFAVPNGCSLCGEEFPDHTGRNRVSVDGGAPAAPDPDHLYRYEVTGQCAALHVHRQDTSTSDDYGMLRIRVLRAG